MIELIINSFIEFSKEDNFVNVPKNRKESKSSLKYCEKIKYIVKSLANYFDKNIGQRAGT